ncbi:AGE family epimerase/isomerase, partial [Paenibacillus sp. 1001270B_150601_E10]|uniref:AGE family epimerase/isomerase n=1 Tax=Paenibacillus sp. 1001270B_150601_E10 TaxID=2787079 RepID=UPI001E362DC0
MKNLAQEVYKELTDHILPYWSKLKDVQHGGFYGAVDASLKIYPQANKGGIAICRLLWTFSAAYRVIQDPSYRELAEHAYLFLRDHVLDHQYGGLYWMVDAEGQPVDTRKHVYTQSFGVYALSEYYRATGDSEALEYAKQLFMLMEDKGYDAEHSAYKEEFNRAWHEQPNEMLSENGVLAEITMNTHIHVLEGYTNLYAAWPDSALRNALGRLLDQLYHHIYDKETKFLGVFFDKEWNSLLDLRSFGHDIEASWLIDRAMKTIGMEKPEHMQMVIDIAYNIARHAIQEDGSLVNEQEGDHIDRARIWWVQAEAIVGFYNAYERTKDANFLPIVEGLWRYTKQHLIDAREGGEWFWSVDEQ